MKKSHRYTIILLLVLIAALFASCREKKEELTSVTAGITVKPDFDFTYGDFSETVNVTDRALWYLTDDCVTVETDRNGDYTVNESVVRNMTRSENSDGSVTYVFEIAKNLSFSDGSPIKAENFLAWTLFILSPAGNELGSISQDYNRISGGLEYHEGKARQLSGLRMLSEYEFSLTVPAVGYDGCSNLPYYYELSYASLRAVNIPYRFGDGWYVRDDGEGSYFAHREGLEFSAENINDNFRVSRFASTGRVTAGAYNIAEYSPEKDELKLEINKYYPGDFSGKKPSVDTIILKYIENPLLSLENREIDLFSGLSGSADINSALDFAENSENKAETCSYNRAGYGFLSFACDRGPAQYTEVRKAVAYLIDRDLLTARYCAGFGDAVSGPYSTSFSMYRETSAYLEKNLEKYTFSPEKAAALLEKAGFVYNSDGSAYSGESLRYRVVSESEAGNYESFCVTTDDGRILMPAVLNWAVTEGNPVASVLYEMLSDTVRENNIGMSFNRTEMSFSDMLDCYYRDIPSEYNMFNLAFDWPDGRYDYSYEFSSDSEMLDAGYNVCRIFDDELDRLSTGMVYGVEYGNTKAYLDMWKKFAVRFNELLPQIPLYSDEYYTIYPSVLQDYSETPFFGFPRAVIEASFGDN